MCLGFNGRVSEKDCQTDSCDTRGRRRLNAERQKQESLDTGTRRNVA